MDEHEGYLDEQTREWVQHEADEYFAGAGAAAAILEAAHAAERAPDDLWAGVRAREKNRRSR